MAIRILESGLKALTIDEETESQSAGLVQYKSKVRKSSICIEQDLTIHRVRFQQQYLPRDLVRTLN